MANEERFNVVQFFQDDSYEYVRRAVSPKDAIDAFSHYISCVGAQLGTTKRVIITDMWDMTNFEWVFGQGITFPPEAVEHMKKRKKEKE